MPFPPRAMIILCSSIGKFQYLFLKILQISSVHLGKPQQSSSSSFATMFCTGLMIVTPGSGSSISHTQQELDRAFPCPHPAAPLEPANAGHEAPKELDNVFTSEGCRLPVVKIRLKQPTVRITSQLEQIPYSQNLKNA
ncbi:hypothetical protein Droror1_Dr00006004 [Drosera rotundifolia]